MIISFARNFLDVIFPRQCYVCKKEGETPCSNCLRSFDQPLNTTHYFITSRYSFKDRRVKNIIHAIKFFGRRDLISPLAQQLVELLPEHPANWTLVPIPSHFFRKITRGYNQAELLAKELSKLSAIPVDDTMLLKKKHTHRQAVAKSRKDRLKGQKGSFVASASSHGKHIILIDDVTTTGATLLEARSCLLQQGATEVLAITIAH